MSTELFLTAYRRQEHELQQRLEHARVARERAADSGRPTADPGAGSRLAVRSHPARAALRWRGLVPTLTAWFARGRDAVREAAAPTRCCSPA